MLIQSLLALLLLTLSACVSFPPQKQAAVTNSVVIETLQGSVNISLTTSSGKMSGNGVLFYQRPESFRLTMLTPFGQTLFDIVVNGEKVTCLMESKKKMWVGTMQELPDWLGVRIWPLLAWVVAPAHPAGPSLVRSFTTADRTVEKVYYDTAGLVRRKVNAVGDEVVYSDYRLTSGSTVPNGIEIRTFEGSSLRLTFDEPEVNQPIDGALFRPQLDRYDIVPLAELKEF